MQDFYLFDSTQDINSECFPRNKELGFVYAIEFGDLVKIGCSASPFKRIKSVCRNMREKNLFPKRVFVSRDHSNYKGNEHIFHNKFSEFRISGTELFRIKFEDVLNFSLNGGLFYDKITTSEKIEKFKERLKELEPLLKKANYYKF